MEHDNNGFLSDEEKLRYFNNKNTRCVRTEEYPYVGSIKMYEGAEVVIYYLNSQEEVIIKDVLVCTNMSADLSGIRATLISRRESKIYQLLESPTYITPHDVILHTPHRCYVERTVKRLRSGEMLEGYTSSLVVRSKSDPEDREVLHAQAVLFSKLETYFTESELDFAWARLEVENEY